VTNATQAGDPGQMNALKCGLEYLPEELTLSSNFSQTCLRIASYPPFFLKLCASPSIADLVADESGRSDALNFRGGRGVIPFPGAGVCSADAMAMANEAIWPLE